MRTPIVSTLAFVLFACQAEKSPAPPAADPTTTVTTTAPTATTTATATTTTTTTATATATAAAPPVDPNDYSSCASDADCEAVPRAGCCDNGYKEAVARGKGDVYRKANACTKKVMCPHFMIVDKRTPACNAARHKCEMVGGEGGAP